MKPNHLITSEHDVSALRRATREELIDAHRWISANPGKRQKTRRDLIAAELRRRQRIEAKQDADARWALTKAGKAIFAKGGRP